MPKRQRSLCKDERGATTIEYALILVFIFLAVAGAWGPLGAEIRGIFGDHAEAMTDARADSSKTD